MQDDLQMKNKLNFVMTRPHNLEAVHRTTITTGMNTTMFGFLILILISCSGSATQPQNNLVPGGDHCDNPDADISCCFMNLPTTLSRNMRICGDEEPGQKLVISGTVYAEDGKTPCRNLVMYAYHTNSEGYYSKTGTETGVQKWHGHLHGWCKTDSNGQYQLTSIRPARYPDNSMPAHIHAAVKTENDTMFWITDFVFKDDSLVDDRYLSSLANPGGTGIVDIRMNAQNIWVGQRDIVLR
jgi:protocatechuate 3,4-dioxygenase, beta subunit